MTKKLEALRENGAKDFSTFKENEPAEGMNLIAMDQLQRMCASPIARDRGVTEGFGRICWFTARQI